MNLLHIVSNRIERAIGASNLNRKQRAELMLEQIRNIGHFTPALTICAAVFVVVFWIDNYSAVTFPLLAVWGCAIIGMNFYGLKAWYDSRKSKKIPRISSSTIKKTCWIAFVGGIGWGILPLLLIDSNGAHWFVNFAAVVGVVFGTSFALAPIPQSAIAFMLPVFLGLTIGAYDNMSTTDFVSLAIFISLFLIAIPVFAIRQARNLVSSVTNQIKMREQKDIISMLLDEYEEHSSDWLWEIDINGQFQNPSQRLVQVSGMNSDKLTKIRLFDFLADSANGKESKTAVETLSQSLEAQSQFRELEFELTIEGESKWWRLTGKPSHDHAGQFTGYVGIGSDITSEKNSKSEINRLALSDPLTGLMNRAKFNKQMDSVVSKLERYGSSFSIMFLDLDCFKIINDTRGHLVGDKLLKIVAKRITDTVRESDAVARLGGDEFAIIMRDNCDAASAARLAGKLLNEVAKPYEIDGERHKIGVSIGIALAPQNGTQPTQLLRNADLALYRSKADGRGVFRFFESQMDSDQREKRMLEGELRQAIEEDQFELYFQPLVSPDDGRPTAMEALIRWNHPIRGMISPAEFIPIAEQSSLIQEIGNWTLREACQIATTWPRDVVVAVNLSAQHFIGSDILTYTKQALDKTGLEPHRLELEITESLLISNTQEVVKILADLKEFGVAIALDDFGTGYSSLSYILKFPFDKIKIDRSFVETSDQDEAARSILRMIGALGESLNIRITAEGVETQEQVEFLKSINCDQFQGFYFSKPLRYSDLPAYFLQHYRENTDEMKAASTVSDMDSGTRSSKVA